ncbi:MAG: hypothetical protein GVX96_00465 [Bacteroidetes bacterium]|jgi:hypothetical protein|nr:hypothetical protein [Bacteroidota bacterium]
MKKLLLPILTLAAFLFIACNEDSQEIDLYPNILEPATLEFVGSDAIIVQDSQWQSFTLDASQIQSVQAAVDQIKQQIESGDYYELFWPSIGYELLSDTEVRVFEYLDSVTIGQDTIVDYRLNEGYFQVESEQGMGFYNVLIWDNNQFKYKLEAVFVIEPDGSLYEDLTTQSIPDEEPLETYETTSGLLGSDLLIGFPYQEGDILVSTVSAVIME